MISQELLQDLKKSNRKRIVMLVLASGAALIIFGVIAIQDKEAIYAGIAFLAAIATALKLRPNKALAILKDQPATIEKIRFRHLKKGYQLDLYVQGIENTVNLELSTGMACQLAKRLAQELPSVNWEYQNITPKQNEGYLE